MVDELFGSLLNVHKSFEETTKWKIKISHNNSSIEDDLFDVIPSHPNEPNIVNPKRENVIERTIDTPKDVRKEESCMTK